MPAEIEKFVFTGEQAWHGEGKRLEEHFTVKTAMKEAELDWDVEVAPIVSDDQKKTAIDKYRITRRIQDNAILGLVRNGHVPIQNRDAFGMFDKIISGKAIIETAGSLQGGSKVFMLAKMPEVIEITKDDPIEKYLLLSNSHDGRRPLQVLFTSVRVVCSNTLSLALGSGQGKLSPSIAIKYEADATIKMKEAERVMAHAVQYYERFGSFIDYLTKKSLVEEQIGNIIAKVFPPNRKLVVTPKIAKHRKEVRRLFDEGKAHEKLNGSAWQLVNAFSEYADHTLAVNKNSTDVRADQMRSIWYGGARGLKQRATNTVLAVVS